MEWAPIGPQLARPVVPHVGYRVDVWATLGLGFWAVYWVRSVPQLGLYRKPSWPHIGYRVDMWAKLGLYVFLGCLPCMEWVPIGPQSKSPVGPHLGYYVDKYGLKDG